MAADEFMPVVAYVVAQAQPRQLVSSLQRIWHYAAATDVSDQCLWHLVAACDFLCRTSPAGETNSAASVWDSVSAQGLPKNGVHASRIV